MHNKYSQIIITTGDSILVALKQMDAIMRKLLMVVDNEKYIGLLSIGDIQRAIINNTDLNCPILNIMRSDYIIARPRDAIEHIRRIMMQIRSEFMPVVDEDQHLIDVYFWEDLFGEQKPKPAGQFNLPVVVMAGGTGSRMKPLTNVLPKPLIPIGEKTILEEIFERFGNHGCNSFYISVNYKAALIRYYITKQNLPYDIKFFKETKPMGSAGSLSLLKGKIEKTFFVTNCDILIDQDYSEILGYHKENRNEITLVAVLKFFSIPYGTVETGENGQLKNLIEKPELALKINSGMYILEPQLLDEIPKNQFFHITQLIEKVSNRKGKIGVFPVSERSWSDIGEWSSYLNYTRK